LNLIPIFPLSCSFYLSMWAYHDQIPPTALDFFPVQVCVFFVCILKTPYLCLPICCTSKTFRFQGYFVVH
jgi:hypothetical protein